jgi:hypothetical protein
VTFGESDLERHLIGLDLPVVDLPTRLYASKEAFMSEHVYKVTELVGSSTISIEDAIQSAVGSIKSDFW